MLLNLPNVQQMMAALGIVPKTPDPLRYLLQQEDVPKESTNRDECGERYLRYLSPHCNGHLTHIQCPLQYDHIMSEVFFFLKEEEILEASL